MMAADSADSEKNDKNIGETSKKKVQFMPDITRHMPIVGTSSESDGLGEEEIPKKMLKLHRQQIISPLSMASESSDHSEKSVAGSSTLPPSPTKSDTSINKTSSTLTASEAESDIKLKPKRRRKPLPRYFGDCSSDDMNSPRRAKRSWAIATKTISQLKARTLSHLPLLEELRQNDPNDFKNYLHMDDVVFNELLNLVKLKLTKQNTQMQECIPSYERVVATLRYLATGQTYEELKLSTGISAQALGNIIPETCQVLYEKLKNKYMKGRLSDSRAIEWTKFYQLLETGNLKFPPKNANVAGLNFVIIGVEGFTLHPLFLRPYSQRKLTYERRVFNYRLSRARNVAEDAFGMLAARVRILHTMINITDPNKMKYIALACCVLHNFLRRKSNTYYSVQSSEEHNNNLTPVLTPLKANCPRNFSEEAKLNRQGYCEYFNGSYVTPFVVKCGPL
ncbi:hypothetical protein NQ314_017291 [Rhamnusium bicolor]|uniref:DDE Tnp4 domain-containing protein n=1 Tax=Rhamnusium bicolor TaxID=1586634 RepID=A0AAV8WTX9_9CUCU|nr:hypothetical protein NQ314_017291 [Rhamnusium bicolor]